MKKIKKLEELFGKKFKWADYQKKVDLKASIASTKAWLIDLIIEFLFNFNVSWNIFDQ